MPTAVVHKTGRLIRVNACGRFLAHDVFEPSIFGFSVYLNGCDFEYSRRQRTYMRAKLRVVDLKGVKAVPAAIITA